ncbi:MAG: methionyl-tRNA formyltransferase [Candidatus Acidiferrales bacterium]
MINNDLRILFIGAHIEAKAPFEQLITTGKNLVGLFTLDDESLAGISGGADLASLAAAARIPVRKGAKVNAPDSLGWIRSLNPDILLVVGWTQLLRQEVLKVPRIACLGFHASLLPKYRGRAPVNWAIINGEKQTGNTMIALEPGADEGDIVAQRVIDIAEDDDCRTIYQKVSLTECDMLAEMLPLIREGRMPRRKQNSLEATVMPRRRPEDGLVDWNWPSRRLYNWVRALTKPYPGAFFCSGSTKITIWKASLDVLRMSSAEAIGSVQKDSDGYPIVVTGDGCVKLLLVQREGEPAVSGAEAALTFLRQPSAAAPAGAGSTP